MERCPKCKSYSLVSWTSLENKCSKCGHKVRKNQSSESYTSRSSSDDTSSSFSYGTGSSYSSSDSYSGGGGDFGGGGSSSDW